MQGIVCDRIAACDYSSRQPHAASSTVVGRILPYDDTGNLYSDGLRDIIYFYNNRPESITTGGMILAKPA
jgi:hypothetical protein